MSFICQDPSIDATHQICTNKWYNLIDYIYKHQYNSSMISFHQYLFRVLMIILDFFIDTYHCDNGYYNNDKNGFRAKLC